MKINKKIHCLLAITLIFTAFSNMFESNAQSSYKRISGRDRYKTSMETARFSSSQVVVFANGNKFADALSSINICNSKNAKLILVDGKNIPSGLDYGSIKKAYIIGGEAAISSSFQNHLNERGLDCIRLNGYDRYDTNIATLEEAGFKEVVLASGQIYADALSSSRLLREKNLGLFLFNKDGRNENVYRYKIKYVLGGKNTVPNVGGNRISGNSRYETARIISENTVSNNVILVSGENFADALSSINISNLRNADIILAPKSYDKKINEICKNAGEVYVVGGENSVSEEQINLAISKVDPEIDKEKENTSHANKKLEKIVLGAKKIDQYKANAPMGCEASSLLMGLQLKGYALDKKIDVFLRDMPIASDNNPNHGFASSPFKYVRGVYQSIFPEPMEKWASRYGDVKNISGSSVSNLKNEISKGNPVVFFGTWKFKKPVYRDYFWGKNAVDNAHVMLMDGYNKDSIHVVDPASGGENGYWVDNETFEKSYNLMKFALVIR